MAQRRASTGTSLRHAGHFVAASGDGSLRVLLISALVGFTKKKKTVAEMSRNEMTAFRKCPQRNTLC